MGALKQVVKYAFDPHFSESPDIRLFSFRDAYKWVSLIFAVSMCAFAVGAIFLRILGKNLPSDKYIDLLTSHPSFKVILILILAPILEELSFRAFQSKSVFWVAVGTTFFINTCITVVLVALRTHPHSVNHLLSNFPGSLLNQLPRLFLIFAVVYVCRKPISNFLLTKNKLTLWTSCLTFAIAHVWNFNIGFHFWLLLLVLPQFLSAFILSYVRNNGGIGSSILVHFLFDATIVTLLWIAQLSKHFAGLMGTLFPIGVVFVFIFLLLYGMYFCFLRKN